MKEVNIYIVTSINNPRRVRNGAGMYLLECIRNGTPCTVQEAVYFGDSCEVEMTLKLLIAALKRFRERSNVKVYLGCRHVLWCFTEQWYIRWRNNDWQHESGKPIKNAELWKTLIPLIEEHEFNVIDEEHTYKSWMLEEIRKEQMKNV